MSRNFKTLIGGSNNVKIIINNWNKFNPRSDRANYSWFRMENKLLESLFSLCDEQKVVYVYLLCKASEKNENGNLDLNVDLCAAILKKTSKNIISTINFLKQENLIDYQMVAESRHEAVMKPSLLPATYERTNVTNETRRDETYGGELAPSLNSQLEAEISFPELLSSVSKIFIERKIKPKLAEAWLTSFPEPDWITQEINKALAWEIANPRSRKKDFGRFMTNWLTRGWDSRRVQGNKQISQTFAQQKSDHNADMLEKVLRGEI